jgi:hypothetical protein
MTRNEAKKLYEGKFFYEIVKPKNTGGIQLFGPFDNIFYINRDLPKDVTDRILPRNEDGKEYVFVQVVDGKPTVAFTQEEILVTDRKL